MFAAVPPPTAPVIKQAEAQDVIEIVGVRRGQILKIDRRTYQVQQTPHSAQKDAVQLLRGLPAVTVAPDDTIMILGSSEANIYFDGHPYRGDTAAYLRSLHGSDIERIELVTNPSAQFAAEGTGGIINFVLRKKRSAGVSGTETIELSSLVGGNSGATLKYKRGRWTFGLDASVKAGTEKRTRDSKLRDAEITVGGVATADRQGADLRSGGRQARTNAKLTYDLDQRTSVSARFQHTNYQLVWRSFSSFAGITSGFRSFSERQRTTNADGESRVELDFDHKGIKQDETLTASFNAVYHPREQHRSVSSSSDGSSFVADQDSRWLFTYGNVDWQHPIGEHELLSIGASWDYVSQDQHYALVSSGLGSLGPNETDQHIAVSNTLAAYATFQRTLGTWTVMPGLRVEKNRRHISSPGILSTRLKHTNLFPTLHVEHPIGKAVELTLSYSKRIDRPRIFLLRPYSLVQDVQTIEEGNPRLEDQSTDSYEINLHYQRKKIDAGIILYDRETRHAWNKIYTVVAGLDVFKTINAGHSRDTGAEFDISTPVASGWKVNGSVNLFDEKGPVDLSTGSSRAGRFRYTTNTTIEWDGPDEGQRPGDVAQLQWDYQSASRRFQTYEFAASDLSLSYTHSFSRTLSITGTADYYTRTGHQLTASFLREHVEQTKFPSVRLKLLKTFGKT